jgi:hypothetical protein
LAIEMRIGAAPALGAAFLIGAALAASCQSATPESTAQPTGSVVGSPSAPVSSPESVWGPLAVIPPQDGSDTGLAVGTLDITETCVYLVQHGQKTLLFWPADRTRWIKKLRAISFSNFDGTVVTAADGDGVSIMGGGDRTDESGVSGREWARQMVWVAPPDPSCFAEVRWGAGGLER